MAGRTKYRYQEYTWLEMREIVKQQPVVVLPIGSVEDHGPHLPLDVDNFFIGSICEEAARRLDGRCSSYPPSLTASKNITWISPARSTLLWNTCCILFSTSLAAWRVMVSRAFFLPTAMVQMPFWIWWRDVPSWRQRRCAAPSSWPSLAKEAIERVRESERPGGMAHACELETSLYLYLDPRAYRWIRLKKRSACRRPVLFGWI